jgi:CHAD domain-containing protein
MSIYTLSLQKTIAQDVRSIALAQLKLAHDNLHRTDNRNKGVYEARKNMKRLRALLRFVKSNISATLYQRENAVYREIAQRLAPLRDSWVVVETLESLKIDRTNTHYISLRKALVKRHEQIAKEFWDSSAIQDVIVLVETAQKRTRFWQIKEDGFDTIRPNIQRTIKTGKEMLALSQQDPTPHNLHEWRKYVKHLWYQTTLLQPTYPDLLDPMIAQLDELGDMLGKAHDFFVLREIVGTIVMNSADHQAFYETLESSQHQLEQVGLQFGAEFYAQDFKAVLKALKHAFRKPTVVPQSAPTKGIA